MLMRGLILLASAVLAGTALAAPETGSRIDSHPMAPESETSDGRDAGILVMNVLGRWLAHRSPKPAAAVLALPFAEAAQDQGARKLLDSECMGGAAGQVSFTTMLVVGAIAEQLIADRKPHIDLATALPAALPAKPRNAFEEIGDCVVGKDPQHVIALLKSKPTSPQEKAGMAALTPAIGACLPANRTFKLSYPVVRSLLSFSAYRRLVVAAS